MQKWKNVKPLVLIIFWWVLFSVVEHPRQQGRREQKRRNERRYTSSPAKEIKEASQNNGSVCRVICTSTVAIRTEFIDWKREWNDHASEAREREGRFFQCCWRIRLRHACENLRYIWAVYNRSGKCHMSNLYSISNVMYQYWSFLRIKSLHVRDVVEEGWEEAESHW